MGKVLSAAKLSFELLGQRITALRLKKSFSESRIYSDWAYDESQMKEADFGKREQKSYRSNRAVGDLFWAAGHMGASVLGSTRTSNRAGDKHLFIHC